MPQSNRALLQWDPPSDASGLTLRKDGMTGKGIYYSQTWVGVLSPHNCPGVHYAISYFCWGIFRSWMVRMLTVAETFYTTILSEWEKQTEFTRWLETWTSKLFQIYGVYIVPFWPLYSSIKPSTVYVLQPRLPRPLVTQSQLICNIT